MRKLSILFFTLAFITSFSQEYKQVKVGQSFNFSYPISYNKVFDLNDSASLQLSNIVQNKYCIIIQDEKEGLSQNKINFSGIEEAMNFYSKNLINSLIDNPNKKISDFKSVTVNGYNAGEILIEGDVYDEEIKKNLTLFYLYSVIETDKFYYQIFSWCLKDKKDTYLNEFRKMANSFKETE